MSHLQASLTRFQGSIGPRMKTRRRRLRKIDSCDPHPAAADRALIPSPARNECELVQQGLSGDSSALDQLFTIYMARLYRTAFAVLRNREDAEDAVQTGLCRAYANLRSFQGRSSFATWLTRIVINSALMLRRRNIIHLEASLDQILDTQPERLHPAIVDAGPSPEEACRITEINRLVEAQVRQLPPGLRAAAQLRDLDALSPADTIQALGIGMSAFKSRISRARQKVIRGLQHSLQPPASMPA